MFKTPIDELYRLVAHYIVNHMEPIVNMEQRETKHYKQLRERLRDICEAKAATMEPCESIPDKHDTLIILSYFKKHSLKSERTESILEKSVGNKKEATL